MSSGVTMDDVRRWQKVIAARVAFLDYINTVNKVCSDKTLNEIRSGLGSGVGCERVCVNAEEVDL